MVDKQIPGEPNQPGAKTPGSRIVGVKAAEKPQEHFLGQVARFIGMAGETVAGAIDQASV
jgi:hypothetical protein